MGNKIISFSKGFTFQDFLEMLESLFGDNPWWVRGILLLSGVAFLLVTVDNRTFINAIEGILPIVLGVLPRRWLYLVIVVTTLLVCLAVVAVMLLSFGRLVLGR